LTKLSAQLAGKMNRDAGIAEAAASANNELKRSAIRTAIKLFHERGVTGLYAGYRLHLSEPSP